MNKVEISTTQNELSSIIELRFEVLRKPWNKPKETATDELEASSINAYIKEGDEVIACGRLQNNGDGIGQIRFMAVDLNYQQKGLGKLIIKRLEAEAHTLKLKTLELQARENAIDFYKSCGYTIKQKTFCLWNIIQHYLMIKSI